MPRDKESTDQREKESEKRQLKHVQERLARAEKKLSFIEAQYAVMSRGIREGG